MPNYENMAGIRRFKKFKRLTKWHDDLRLYKSLEYFRSYKHDEKINYIDVGCGNGLKTVKNAKALGRKNVIVNFLEPTKLGCISCKRHASKNKIKDFRIRCLKFEKLKTNQKFDLITSIHSLYYVDKKFLPKILDILSDKGIAIIIIEPIKNNKLTKFREFVYNEIRKEAKRTNAEDVVESLKKRGAKIKIFKDCYKFEPLIKAGKINSAGKTVVEFLCSKDWKKISKTEARKIEPYLKKNFKNGKPFNYYINTIVVRK